MYCNSILPRIVAGIAWVGGLSDRQRDERVGAAAAAA